MPLNNIKIDRFDYLILTDTHFGHAENANKIKEKYRPMVIVHMTEAPYLTSGITLNPDGNKIGKKLRAYDKNRNNWLWILS